MFTTHTPHNKISEFYLVHSQCSLFDKLPTEIVLQISDDLDDKALLTLAALSLRFLLSFLPIVSKRNDFSLEKDQFLIQEDDSQHILPTLYIAATNPYSSLPLNHLKEIHCVLGLNSTLGYKLDHLHKIICRHAELNRITFDLAPSKPWEDGYLRIANDYGWMWKFALAFNAAVGKQGSTVRVVADDLRGGWPSHGRPFLHTFCSDLPTPHHSNTQAIPGTSRGDGPSSFLVTNSKDVKQYPPAVDCDGRHASISSLFDHLSHLVTRVNLNLTWPPAFGRCFGRQQSDILRKLFSFSAGGKYFWPLSSRLSLAPGYTAGDSGVKAGLPFWPPSIHCIGQRATPVVALPTVAVPLSGVGTYGPTATYGDLNVSWTNQTARNNAHDKKASNPTETPSINVKSEPKDPKLILPLADHPQAQIIHIHAPQLFALPFFNGTMHVLRHSPIVELSLDKLQLSHYDWTIILRGINIPTLKKLALGDSQIAYPDLLDFLNRHPAITHFDLSKGVAIGKLEYNCLAHKTARERRRNSSLRESNGEPGQQTKNGLGLCHNSQHTLHHHHHHHHHHRQILPELTCLAGTPEYLVHFLLHPCGLPKLQEVIMASDYRDPIRAFDFGTFDAVFDCLVERPSITSVGLRLFSLAGLEEWMVQCLITGSESGGADEGGKHRFGSIHLDRLVMEIVLPTGECSTPPAGATDIRQRQMGLNPERPEPLVGLMNAWSKLFGSVGDFVLRETIEATGR